MTEQQLLLVTTTLFLAVIASFTASSSASKTNELYRIRMARRAARKRIAARERALAA